jgi:hypothetical protein
VADQLYLSYRLNGFSAFNMLRQYEKALKLFPFSKLSTARAIMRVTAVAFGEPPLTEDVYEYPLDLDVMIEAARTFVGSDCAIELETHWELWDFADGEWKLAPAPVSILAFGPEFESESEDHVRINLGLDSRFLPNPSLPNHLFMAQSNVRSLLHLVEQFDRSLPVESRRLWTESGENFAEQLQAMVGKQ